jgi:hypothetical protein
VQLAIPVSEVEIRRFARQQGWFSVLDQEGFVVFSPSASRARRVMTVDQSAGDHTRALGLALGYPPCCARAAARVGDHELDAWAAHVAGRRTIGRFALTSPAAYRAGRALVSHVPCSPRCVASLAMAEAAGDEAARRLQSRPY